MQLLYCPECLEYLEGGDGIMQDCTCGWKQPDYEDNEILRKDWEREIYERCDKEDRNNLEDEI